MTRFAFFSLAFCLAAPAIAQDQPASGQPSAEQPTTLINAPPAIGAKRPAPTADEAARKVTQCDGERFVFAWGAGASPTKVTLCSDKGASHEQVVRMLEDAATKLERTAGLADDRRKALVQQMRGKIAELEKAEKTKTKLAEAPEPAVASGLVSNVPPLPRAKAATPVATAASSVLLLPKPRLSFECYTPGEIGIGGPCVTFNRETRITVKAGEIIQPATSLRFIRNRDFRAEVQIGPMRKGQSKRVILPSGVCGGVVETEIEIAVARGGHVVDTRGPYLMRC